MKFVDAIFTTKVSGSVIAHQPWFTKRYIGSPSICILSENEFVVAHDFFGPNSQEFSQPETQIYRSTDQGITWQPLSVIIGAFWSRLFWHEQTLYLLGTDAHYGNLVIRKSMDRGKTWSNPTNNQNGRIQQGQFHCAPTPIVTHNNRLYAAVEFADGDNKDWGKRFGASIFSVSTTADLLDANNWFHIAPNYYHPEYLDGDFGGWLEGNAVIGADDAVYNVLRVENDATYQETAAVLQVDSDMQEFVFDPSSDFVPFPGGSKKFSIRYDATSGLYMTLANTIPAGSDIHSLHLESDAIRNQVSLVVSPDLRNWRVVATVLNGTSTSKTAFQYISWDFLGDDIVFVARTAYYDMWGGAKSYHDSNYLTFHHIHNFRQYISQ